MKSLVPILVLATAPIFAAEITTVEEIIAKCNGDIVTKGDLDRARRELIGELRQNGVVGVAVEQRLTEKQKDFLRDRIDQLLLVQKAKDLDIKVDSDIAKRIASMQTESGIADPDKFHDWVKEQSGMSFEDFKDEMKLFVREILISTEGKDDAGVAAAEKKAKDLVASARRGERFAELARDNSDSVSAKSMGELPPYTKGQMAPDLEDKVWSQPKGYITDPIRVRTGFLILRVEDHQKAGQAELAEVENEVTEKLFAPRMQPAIRQYLTKLRQEAFLQIKSDWIDTGAAPGKDTSWGDAPQLKPETVKKAEVSSKIKHKRLLWTVPVPGTSTGGTSSSQ
jgi:parvulin-like peptidyl-prolyl isomerase